MLDTTKPVRLPVTPKHGPSTVFVFPKGRSPYGNSILLITPSNLSLKVAKNEKNDVFFNFFQNHFCTKLWLLPPKLAIHNPPKTCLEMGPRRTAFIKKITTQKLSGQMSRFAVIFGFCTLIAGTQEIITSRDEHRGSNLIFMSLKHPPPLSASRFSVSCAQVGSQR